MKGTGSSGYCKYLKPATKAGAQQQQSALRLAAAVAVALGLALVAWRGWPVLAIGTASLLAALAYMGGPRPIAYSPFGELTVFLFFGLVAVLGTQFSQNLLADERAWFMVLAEEDLEGLPAFVVDAARAVHAMNISRDGRTRSRAIRVFRCCSI